MKFCEKRYARKMISEFTAKLHLAREYGGNDLYFEHLVSIWKDYFESLK